MKRSEVLIVGAGPTGLVLALWLAKLGVKVRIVDRIAEPGTTSRAVAVQARTLELYGQMDLAGEVVERGHKTPAVNLWVKGRKAARAPFETVGLGLTPYPFLFIFPQDQHERLLALDQQALVLVLREDEQERVGGEAQAHRLEGRPRGLPALDPQIDRRRLVAALDHFAGEVHLAIEFERPRLDRHGPRGGPRLGDPIDDANLDAQLGQPQRQHQPRRPRPDDQHLAPLHPTVS